MVYPFVPAFLSIPDPVFPDRISFIMVVPNRRTVRSESCIMRLEQENKSLKEYDAENDYQKRDKQNV